MIIIIKIAPDMASPIFLTDKTSHFHHPPARPPPPYREKDRIFIEYMLLV